MNPELKFVCWNFEFTKNLCPTPFITRNKIIEDQAKRPLKILKFSSKSKFDEIPEKISKLDPQKYKDFLLYFLIEVENLEFSFVYRQEKESRLNFEPLKKSLLEFTLNRSMLLQLKSINENESRFCYKEENSNQFVNVDRKDFEEVIDGEVLTLIFEKEEASINSQFVEEIKGKIFENFFMPRNLLKVCKTAGVFNRSPPYLVPCPSSGKYARVSMRETETGYRKEAYCLNTEVEKILANKEEEVIEKPGEKMSQEEMLEDVKNQKFAVISDEIGSGKSWLLRKFTQTLRKKYPEKKVYYVDLNQFMMELKAPDGELEFVTFMTEKILKPKNNFEAEIFKKLYKNGQVCILFDGFDEIASDCAEFVTKLFQSFQQNGQNQLWIATRDNFEVNLKEALNLDFVYKLDYLFAKPMDEVKKSLLFEVKDKKSLKFHQILWTIIQKHFHLSEMLDLIKCRDDNGRNLLQIAIEKSPFDIAKMTWMEIKSILKRNGQSSIAEYLNYQNNNHGMVHHVLLETNDVVKLKYFWIELEDSLADHNSKCRRISGIPKCYENILHYAPYCKNIEYYETLWNLLWETFDKRYELEYLIIQKNSNANNFIHLLVMYNRFEIIEFIFTKIKENFKSKREHVNFFRSRGHQNRNLIQQALFRSKDIKTIQFLVKIFKNTCEYNNRIFEAFCEVDSLKNNALHIAATFSTGDIFEFMIEELEKIANREEIRKILRTFAHSNKNLLQVAARQNKSLEINQILWKFIRKCFDFPDIWNMINHIDEDGNNLFLTAAECSSKEIFELTWNEIKKFFIIENGTGLKNPAKLKNLLLKKSKLGNNFLSVLTVRSAADMIELAYEKLCEDFTFEDCLEIFQQGGAFGKNLLQIAACNSKDIKTHQILWQIFQDFSKSDEEFLEYLMEVDILNKNVFYLAAYFTTSEIFEFMIKELEKIASQEEIRNILSTLGTKGRNLLQSDEMQKKIF